MASPAKRLKANAPGAFYVDATCIDCATCRWVAPASFEGQGEASRVYRQPETPEEVRRAEMAILACPVAAIGSEAKRDLTAARAAFPDPIEYPVHHCGYHSEDSFGAASYLILRADGNVLVDSPRFARPLVERIEALGGIRYMHLTHMDDVADHAKFQAHFGCERILHAADIRSGTRGVEIKIDGEEPVDFAPDLTLIPTPGHTRGSMCLLFNDRFLFTGDHIAWSPTLGQIYAFRGVCWYDWAALSRSVERLSAYRFEWILPGHGYRCRFDADQMPGELARCLDWMKAA
jgi:glyoxylase-like metal-dependent hydrolase (beta-lactamase superfamily II)/ferredoxin